jgi:hypothetical protein
MVPSKKPEESFPQTVHFLDEYRIGSGRMIRLVHTAQF